MVPEEGESKDLEEVMGCRINRRWNREGVGSGPCGRPSSNTEAKCGRVSSSQPNLPYMLWGSSEGRFLTGAPGGKVGFAAPQPRGRGVKMALPSIKEHVDVKREGKPSGGGRGGMLAREHLSQTDLRLIRTLSELLEGYQWNLWT